MKIAEGVIVEILQTAGGARYALIDWPGCPPPRPGQFLQAYRPPDETAAAITLYPGGFTEGEEISQNTFTCAPPIPLDWQPGDTLILRGPLGSGFSIPESASRVLLADMGASLYHLLPLVEATLQQGGEVAVFTDADFPRLPARVEVSPLRNLLEALSWGDYLALAGTPQALEHTKHTLLPVDSVHCAAQVMLIAPMPCGGMAACGVCALSDPKGNMLLVCEDGPVFDWRDL